MHKEMQYTSLPSTCVPVYTCPVFINPNEFHLTADFKSAV